MGDWIKNRGTSGEWGYLNVKTGLFRTTLPNSNEEKEQELRKRNDAVVRLHSANQSRFLRESSHIRNHGSEAIKKQVDVPVMISDSQGNLSEGHVRSLAPFEDSVGGVDPLALLYVEGVALGPILKGIGRGVEYGSARLGAGWARNRIIGRLLKQQVDRASLPKWWSAPTLALSEELAESVRPISKNAYNYDNIPILGSNLTGTTKSLGKYKFDILGLTYVDDLNLDLALNEMPRRLKALGYDLDKEKVLRYENGKLTTTPSSLWLEENLTKPNYIGTFDRRGIGGIYNYSTRDAYVSVGRTADSDLFHERVMHGTDDIIDNLSRIKGKTPPRQMYENFVENALSKGEIVETPEGTFIKSGDNMFPISSGKWKEARSTIGEVQRAAYDAIRRSKGGKTSVEDMREEFEAAIDRMDGNTLKEFLKGMNSYGNAYVTVGGNNPGFVDNLKYLIKYAPMTTTALIPKRRINNKKKGGILKALDGIIVPKSRKIIRTININNGKLTLESDSKGNKYWFRNGKYITPTSNYKIYDKSIGGYRSLYQGVDNTPGYYAHTPFLDKLEMESKKEYGDKFNYSTEDIPKEGQSITLRTKGTQNLATIPISVLDSIAINTGRSNTSIKTNLGLVGKESTFGGMSIPLKKDPRFIHSNDLVNNHAFFNSPKQDYKASIMRKLLPAYSLVARWVDKHDLTDSLAIEAEKLAEDAYKNSRFKETTPQYHENILADAFMRYAANPKGYNPGQSNYSKMVDNIGSEVWNEKLIQNWWNTEGESFYKKGLKEYNSR